MLNAQTLPFLVKVERELRTYLQSKIMHGIIRVVNRGSAAAPAATTAPAAAAANPAAAAPLSPRTATYARGNRVLQLTMTNIVAAGQLIL
ncbi:uncharacterized protein BP01DRAFT_382622 [Aspergillus saccharolyticus JOP 1030-1]|uniref:Uncharacterized protein n=1 Tax=Aspergillus saccharolyticus JOP 1030-1 TaxID=1450539 RepID=A0A318ZMD6_9EURO|nr:hypothetical protein BP01DRAFT_382622 [Aspergillus saccharolyticus JOP 1030-1]PYH45603.1 hypothetical protein BP01DRAFT_382622 [Aspergillus saccharolyticus JOP 1030-1]